MTSRRPVCQGLLVLVLGSMTSCYAPQRGSRAVGPAEVPPAGPGPAASERDSSDSLPQYMLVQGLSGKITSVGDSTATNLVARAAAEFRRVYPEVRFHAMSGLADVGLQALRDGRADIVPMSRALTPQEISDLQRKLGYPPTQVKVAADALAVYVASSNPVSGLTLDQLDAIFSRTQRRGSHAIENWGQVGLAEPWADRPITLYGYDPADGVNQVFRQLVLLGGEYRLSMRIERTGSAIVQDVATDPQGIGCASIFFMAKGVRAVPLAGSDGQYHAPTAENVRARQYPLSRFLYLCVNKPPNRPHRGPVAEFVRFLLSREGQDIVAAGGNIALDAATAEQGRRALD